MERPVLYLERSPVAYRTAVRMALVCGGFSLLVAALMAYDYALRWQGDPSEHVAYQALKAAAAQQPDNAALKAEIRRLDAQIRREYFRQRAFMAIGAVLLGLGLSACVGFGRLAVVLRRRLPQPDVAAALRDYETEFARPARWAVGLMAAVLFLAAAGLGVWAYLGTPAGLLVASAPEPGQPLGRPSETPGPVPPVTPGQNPGQTPPDGSPGGQSGGPSGTLLWQKPVPVTALSTKGELEVMQDTGYAAPTTATDGRLVFAIFANGDLAAFDFQGNLAWSHSFGIPKNAYGHASSLVTYQNLLFVQLDQGEAKDKLSKLYAFDIRTGKVVWSVDREVPNSWTTPIVIHAAERDQLITAADPWVIAYQPGDGREIWRADCLRQDIGPSPTFANGVVYVATEYRCLSAIRADGQGDVTETHILWQAEDGLPDTCSPLATDEYVFVLATYGILTCYDAQTGEWLWELELEGNFQSSPSLVGNLVYVISDEGKAWVVEPKKSEGKIVSEADLGEKCVTSPAFQPGRIYLRGAEHLFCIGKKQSD